MLKLEIKERERDIRGEIVAIKFAPLRKRSKRCLEQRRGMCICLWKCAPPLRQWVCPWRDRGREGSAGAQVIEVSPPLPFFFFFLLFQGFVPHPFAPSPALSTQRAQLRSPSPRQLAPMIPHFLLNATPSALSLLTSQHPLWGNG